MLNQQKAAKASLDIVLRELSNKGWVAANQCDDIKWQYDDFLENVEHSKLEFGTFHFTNKSDRIDNFLHQHMGSKPCYQALWKVCKMLLILSHGQASVERGFSINKQIAVENLQERSFIAQRVVIDYLKDIGGLSCVVVSPAMLLSASKGRQRYHEYLAEEEKKKKAEQMARKHKTTHDEIATLKKRKLALDADIVSLESSADTFAEKAEVTRQVQFITKFNALRRTAKEKKKEMLK